MSTKDPDYYDNEASDELVLMREQARLRAEVERLTLEVETVKDIHQRILSWKPQNVQFAKTVLLQLAARHARQGHDDGKRYVEAVDSLMKFVSQTRADADALRAVLGRAAGVLARYESGVFDQGELAGEMRREIEALGGEPEAKCATCGGTGVVSYPTANRSTGPVGGNSLRSGPCPDCKRQPPRED